MFTQANAGPVPHLHPGEIGFETDPGFLALEQIFIWIKGEVALLIHEINRGVLDFNGGHGTAVGGNPNRYENAVKALKSFVNTLNDETPLPPPPPGGPGNFGPTINFAEVEPILDGSGFYTSARIVVQWQGGTHSGSSLIHVP